MWDSYKSSSPFTKVSKDGSLSFNEDRVSWDSFAKQYNPTSAATLPKTPQQSEPSGTQPQVDRKAALKAIAAKYPGTPEGRAQARAEAQSLGLL